MEKWFKAGRIFIAALLLVVIVAALLPGCYTEQKATKQVDKAAGQYPEMVAKKTRDKFPCITTSVDSSQYLSSIDSLKKYLGAAEKETDAVKARQQHIYDSLVQQIGLASNEFIVYDCGEETKAAYAYAAKLQAKTEQQEKTINKLTSSIGSIKPVYVKTEDSAKIFLYQKELSRANDSTLYYKTLYQADHEWRLKKEQREKGNLVILIPWILIIAAALIGALLVFIQVRSGGILKFFNHLKAK